MRKPEYSLARAACQTGGSQPHDNMAPYWCELHHRLQGIFHQ